ncbi:MAG: rod shape-determining protein MreC, partial [Betaproteobacteria bacterium]|nr:rod shape-determining protein MreC [Betaproteobacteria bacterium]
MEHSPPPFFKRGPTPLVRLLLCSLLSVALLISDARYQYLDGIRQAVAIITYPLQRAAAAPAAMLYRVGEFFVTQSALRNENARLAEQVLQNGAVLQKYRALAAENAHLRELLAMRQRFPESTVVAEVLYSGRDPFTRKIVVDKGSQDDVKAGRPVIDHSGVVGQVTRVYPWLAEVTLITDTGQAVPVQNLRNGLRAVLGGTGSDGQLELKFIPLNADFQNGDELVTSGIDGIYPHGLPVAVVSNVERNAAYLFAR